MARTRVRWGRLAALGVSLTVLAAGTAAWAGGGTPGNARVRQVPVTVRAGDTLWSIARRVVGERGDPRPLVQELIERNRIVDGRILPGQRLLVPVP